MINFLSLYRGRTLSDARVVAISSDPVIVHDFTDRLLSNNEVLDDTALSIQNAGQREALRLIKKQMKTFSFQESSDE